MNDDFQPDAAETPEEKNIRLRDLLMGTWRYKNIEIIERQEAPKPKGWYARFVDVD